MTLELLMGKSEEEEEDPSRLGRIRQKQVNGWENLLVTQQPLSFPREPKPMNPSPLSEAGHISHSGGNNPLPLGEHSNRVDRDSRL